MKTILILLVLSLNVAACDETTQQVTLNKNNQSQLVLTQWASHINSLPAEPLSEAEIKGMMFMREEEKLAHDVYAYLFNKWGLRPFQNIAASESRHMDAMLNLLKKYNLEDPAANTGAGEFLNEELQALYNTLIAKGEKSLEEALRVGALIEETDIRDIKRELDLVNNEDIKMVYQNLMRGSENHLRAFVRNINKRGSNYEPLYLDQALYNEIINSPMQRGNR